MGSSVCYDAILGAVNLKQVRNTSFAPNVEIIRDRAGASTAAAFIGVLSANPQVTFTTGDVAGVIGGIPVGTGLWVPSGTITVPFAERAVGGTFSGTLSHMALSAVRGLVAATTFSASHNDQAGATAEVLCQLLSSDGITQPVSVAVNQSLAASTFNALYRMGPVVVNSTQLTSVTQFSVTTGLQIEPESYDGEPFARNAYLMTEIDPTISITFKDFDTLATYGPLFASLTSAVAYFRKNADGGVTVADITAEHCSFTAGAGLSVNQEATAAAQQSGSASIVLQPKTLAASATAAIAV